MMVLSCTASDATENGNGDTATDDGYFGDDIELFRRSLVTQGSHSPQPRQMNWSGDSFLIHSCFLCVTVDIAVAAAVVGILLHS